MRCSLYTLTRTHTTRTNIHLLTLTKTLQTTMHGFGCTFITAFEPRFITVISRQVQSGSMRRLVKKAKYLMSERLHGWQMLVGLDARLIRCPLAQSSRTSTIFLLPSEQAFCSSTAFLIFGRRANTVPVREASFLFWFSQEAFNKYGDVAHGCIRN